MLTITFLNKEAGITEIASYDVKVNINNKMIYSYTIHNHNLSDGWETLVEQFLKQVKETEDDL